jgi:hypothetical protein
MPKLKGKRLRAKMLSRDPLTMQFTSEIQAGQTQVVINTIDDEISNPDDDCDVQCLDAAENE